MASLGAFFKRGRSPSEGASEPSKSPGVGSKPGLGLAFETSSPLTPPPTHTHVPTTEKDAELMREKLADMSAKLVEAQEELKKKDEQLKKVEKYTHGDITKLDPKNIKALKGSQADSAKLHLELINLQTKLSSAEKELEEMKKSKDAEISRLKADVEKLTSKVKNQVDELSARDEQFKMMTTKLEELESANEEATKNLQKMRADVEKMKAEAQTRERELKNVKGENSQLKEDIKALIDESEETSKEIKELQELLKLSDSAKNADLLAEATGMLKRELAEVKEKLKEKTAECEGMSALVAASQREIAERDKKLKQAKFPEFELRKASEDREAAMAEMKAAVDERDAIKGQNEVINLQLRSLDEQYTEAKKEQARLQRKVREYMDEVAERQEQIHTLTEKLRVYTDTNLEGRRRLLQRLLEEVGDQLDLGAMLVEAELVEPGTQIRFNKNPASAEKRRRAAARHSEDEADESMRTSEDEGSVATEEATPGRKKAPGSAKKTPKRSSALEESGEESELASNLSIGGMIEALKEKLAATEHDKAELEAETDFLRERVRELERAAPKQAAAAAAGKKAAPSESGDESVVSLTSMINELKEKVAHGEQERAELEDELQAATEKLEKCEHELAALKKQKQGQEAPLAKQAPASAAKMPPAPESGEESDLGSSISIGGMINELKEKIANGERERMVLEEELERMTEKLRLSERALEAVKKQQGQAQKKAAPPAAESGEESDAASHISLSGMISELKEKVAASERGRAELEEELEAVQAELDSAAAARDDAERQVANLRREVAALERRLADKERERRALESAEETGGEDTERGSTVSIGGMIEALKEKLAAAERAKGELEAEVDLLQRELSEARREREASERALAKLKREREHQAVGLSAVTAASGAAAAGLAKQLDEVQREKEALARKLHEKSAALDRALRETQELAASAQETETEVAELRALMKTATYAAVAAVKRAAASRDLLAAAAAVRSGPPPSEAALLARIIALHEGSDFGSEAPESAPAAPAAQKLPPPPARQSSFSAASGAEAASGSAPASAARAWSELTGRVREAQEAAEAAARLLLEAQERLADEADSSMEEGSDGSARGPAALSAQLLKAARDLSERTKSLQGALSASARENALAISALQLQLRAAAASAPAPSAPAPAAPGAPGPAQRTPERTAVAAESDMEETPRSMASEDERGSLSGIGDEIERLAAKKRGEADSLRADLERVKQQAETQARAAEWAQQGLRAELKAAQAEVERLSRGGGGGGGGGGRGSGLELERAKEELARLVAERAELSRMAEERSRQQAAVAARLQEELRAAREAMVAREDEAQTVIAHLQEKLRELQDGLQSVLPAHGGVLAEDVAQLVLASFADITRDLGAVRRAAGAMAEERGLPRRSATSSEEESGAETSAEGERRRPVAGTSAGSASSTEDLVAELRAARAELQLLRVAAAQPAVAPAAARGQSAATAPAGSEEREREREREVAMRELRAKFEGAVLEKDTAIRSLARAEAAKAEHERSLKELRVKMEGLREQGQAALAELRRQLEAEVAAREARAQQLEQELAAARAELAQREGEVAGLQELVAQKDEAARALRERLARGEGTANVESALIDAIERDLQGMERMGARDDASGPALVSPGRYSPHSSPARPSQPPPAAASPVRPASPAGLRPRGAQLPSAGVLTEAEAALERERFEHENSRRELARNRELAASLEQNVRRLEEELRSLMARKQFDDEQAASNAEGGRRAVHEASADRDRALQRLASAEKERALVQKELEDVKGLLRGWQERAQALQDAVAALQGASLKSEAGLAQAKGELLSLSAELQHTRRQLDEAAARAEAAERRASDPHAAPGPRPAPAAAAPAGQAAVGEEAGRAQGSPAKGKKQAGKEGKGAGSSKDLVGELQEELQLLRDEMDHDGLVVSALKREVAAKSDEIALLKQSVALAEQATRAEEARSAKVQERLQAQLAEAQRDVAQSSLRIADLEADLARLKLVLTETEGEAARQRLAARDREAEVGSVRPRLEELQGQVRALEQRLAEVSAEKARIGARLEEEVDESRRLREEVGRRKEALRILESEVLTLRQTVAEQEERAREAARDFESLEAQILGGQAPAAGRRPAPAERTPQGAPAAAGPSAGGPSPAGPSPSERPRSALRQRPAEGASDGEEAPAREPAGSSPPLRAPRPSGASPPGERAAARLAAEHPERGGASKRESFRQVQEELERLKRVIEQRQTISRSKSPAPTRPSAPVTPSYAALPVPPPADAHGRSRSPAPRYEEARGRSPHSPEPEARARSPYLIRAPADFGRGGSPPKTAATPTAAALAAAGGGGVALSLQQTRDLVEAVYTSKAKFDRICARAGLPRETVAQHLQTFLNQRYGLKAVCQDYTAALERAVADYGEVDNDVAVFGRILRNDLDEDFRFVQKQLKATSAEQLKEYLRGRFPRKSDLQVQALLKDRTAGHISEEEMLYVVRNMYGEEDARSVLARVRAFLDVQARQRRAAVHEPWAESLRPQGGAGKGRAEGEGRLLYSDFTQILLNFQLQGHERYLHSFLVLFRQYDKDRDGVLQPDELHRLLEVIHPHKGDRELRHLLAGVDASWSSPATFSQCVALLGPDAAYRCL